MPGQLLHLAVARGLAADMPTGDWGQFYLGSLAPDAIHAFGDAPRHRKVASHLLSADKQMHNSDNTGTRERVLAFCREKTAHTAFFRGYCVHILTDIFWAETVFHPFVTDSRLTALSERERDAIYYYDLERLSFALLGQEDWVPGVWEALRMSRAPADGVQVSAREIDRWRDRTLTWYDGHEAKYREEAKILTPDIFARFVRGATEDVRARMALS